MNSQSEAISSSVRAITCDELTQMLEKYNIGKKPLASLLGWGETTVLVYLSQGQIPDNEYSRRLYSLYISPEEYCALLYQNGKVLTPVAYRKSMDAVRNLLPQGDMLSCLEFLYSHCSKEISLLRANTVLFYSQVLSMTLHGRPLFEDEYAPDAANLPYKKLAEYNQRLIALISTSDGKQPLSVSSSLSEQSKQILSIVYEVLDWVGPKALSGLLALEHHRLLDSRGGKSRRSITNEGLQRFYTEFFGMSKFRRMSDFEQYIQISLKMIRGKRPALRDSKSAADRR